MIEIVNNLQLLCEFYVIQTLVSLKNKNIGKSQVLSSIQVCAVWSQIFLAYLSATRRRLLLSSEIKHGQKEEWKLNTFGWLYSHTQTVVVGSLDPHARTEKNCNLFLFNFLKLEKLLFLRTFDGPKSFLPRHLL